MSDEFTIDRVELARVETRVESGERCPLCDIRMIRGACPGCSGSPAAARRIQQIRARVRGEADA